MSETNCNTQHLNFKGKRILLAEDNDLSAEVAIAILNDAGVEVTRVVNGKECVKALAEADPGKFDAIFMDILMPEMDGYRASREIRAMGDPQKSEIPIIAMTSKTFDEDRWNCLVAGMNAHLAKPIDPKELFNTLGEFI